MNKTKKKIILAAIELFNEQGLANVKNQDIAKNASVSLSNFNYHFGTKKDLIFAVFDYIGEHLKRDVYGDNTLITGDDYGISTAKRYFEFEQKYRFFYLDTHNILQMYPELKKAVNKQIKEAIQVIKNINYLSIGKGYLKPPPEEMPELYDQLAQQIWINTHFWFAQMTIREMKGDVVLKGMEANYAITYPYLTEKGKEKFLAFFKLKKGEKK